MASRWLDLLGLKGGGQTARAVVFTTVRGPNDDCICRMAGRRDGNWRWAWQQECWQGGAEAVSPGQRPLFSVYDPSTLFWD